MVKAIVGANWGDEGKGKITDMLAEESDIVVRFQGGSNAGHTIINDYGKFALHLLPSGVFYNHITSVIGNGVASVSYTHLKKAIEEGVTAEEISKRYIKECKKDMAGMNIKPATTHPLACLLYTSQ